MSDWLSKKITGKVKDGRPSDFVRRYMLEEAGHKCSECGWGKPNPTNGIINLKSDFASNNEAVITDINGRLIQTFRISKNTQELDLSTFENGVYFIHYNNTTVKIVKS